MKQEKITLGRHSIPILDADKVLVPDGITKSDIVGYYRQVAEYMLPHLRGRPLIMQRFPEGVGRDGVFQHEAPPSTPDWVKRTPVEHKGKTISYVVCENTASLVYLASQGGITPHVWLSRTDKPEQPDMMIFDLDPTATGEFEAVRMVALSLRALLEELGLPAYLKTTGSRGLHVTVPLNRAAEFETVGQFAGDVASVLAEREPARVTLHPDREKRDAPVFVGTGRNASRQTVVPPYSVRAYQGAPVAAPIDWSELVEGQIWSQRYTTKSVFQRMARKGDPWEEFWRHGRSLKEPRRKLDSMKVQR
jgi:bifunctional non-homologous end joining protein LigD